MQTIVFPTDFSAVADNALSFANALADRSHARVILLHTYHIPVLAPMGGGYAQMAPTEEMEREMNEKLQLLCQNLSRNYPNVRYETKVVGGMLVDVLPVFAKEASADMIVMGTEVASGIKQVLVGTRSAEVLSEATCPVLVIPAESHFKGLEQIVFAADLRENPSADMHKVVELARLFEAEILFLYVPINGQDELSDDDWKKFYESLAYHRISFHIQKGSRIEEGIQSFADKMSADLIVMVNHRRRFWDQLLVASQTKQMAYHTKIPLLVLHKEMRS